MIAFCARDDRIPVRITEADSLLEIFAPRYRRAGMTTYAACFRRSEANLLLSQSALLRESTNLIVAMM
jgi:hypothetical protein